MTVSTWEDAWGEGPGPTPPSLSARVASLTPLAPSETATAATPSTYPNNIEAVLDEIARLRSDLARRDAITAVVVGVLLAAILQHITRMHEEFSMMTHRVGILH